MASFICSASVNAMLERASNPGACCFFFPDFATLSVALTLFQEEGLGASSVFILEDQRRIYKLLSRKFWTNQKHVSESFHIKGIALLVYLNLCDAFDGKLLARNSLHGRFLGLECVAHSVVATANRKTLSSGCEIKEVRILQKSHENGQIGKQRTTGMDIGAQRAESFSSKRLYKRIALAWAQKRKHQEVGFTLKQPKKRKALTQGLPDWQSVVATNLIQGSQLEYPMIERF
ncbi:hypothetical protein Tco_1272404 [Tanacetum coccineum]